MRLLLRSAAVPPLVAAVVLTLVPRVGAQSPAPAPAPARAAPTADAAEVAEVADLAALLAPIRERHDVPALGAAVLVDGRLAALGASGIRRAGDATSVTRDDLWHLGSCTKVMTATLLARRVEAGALQWTTTVAAALPDLAETMHADSRAITLAQLLSHRAGLPGGPPRELWNRLWTWTGSLPDARTEVARTMLGVAPEAALGERYRYSNASYVIAGAILERAGKASWEEQIGRDLWRPLGITTGGFGAPGEDGKTLQPWGHRPGKDGGSAEPRFEDNPPAHGPAGTVHMSLRDWARFAALHLGVPAADGTLLLQPSTLAAMRTPPAGDYALGWSVTRRPWAPGPILTHTGSNTMWFCLAWLAPDAKFAVLVTCNHGRGEAACDAVAGACIARFRPARK